LLVGRVGRETAYILLRGRVEEAIRNAYPEL
jgi:hypothetical protein